MPSPLLANVYSIEGPALWFLVLATTLGYVAARIFRRVTVPALCAALIVAGGFALARKSLHGNAWAYAQDLVYESTFRDVFRHPLEWFFAALFHFGLPCLLVAGLVKMAAKGEPAVKRA